MTYNPTDYARLRLLAEMYHDAQQHRVAASNRAERASVDPEVYSPHIELLEKAEHQLKLALRRCFRKVAPPGVIAWQKQNKGIGEHLLARLIGHLGHPGLAFPYHWEGAGKDSRLLVADAPYQRSLSQLWSYCGHGDPLRKRSRGMDKEAALAAGNPLIKALVHLLAEACMKQTGAIVPSETSCFAPLSADITETNTYPKPTRPASQLEKEKAATTRGTKPIACSSQPSPYRVLYDQFRLQYADSVHKEPCIRCGPSGKPAAVGTPWSKAHQHASALRRVGKEILRDLWIAARRDLAVKEQAA